MSLRPPDLARVFRCDRAERGGVTVLALHGSLDAFTSIELKKEAVALAATPARKVLLDLAALEVIDSTGIGVLISLFKRLRAVDGHLCFANLVGQPREVIRVLRLDRSFTIADTVDDGLAALREV